MRKIAFVSAPEIGGMISPSSWAYDDNNYDTYVYKRSYDAYDYRRSYGYDRPTYGYKPLAYRADRPYYSRYYQAPIHHPGAESGARVAKAVYDSAYQRRQTNAYPEVSDLDERRFPRDGT